jgi:putative endonuclease
MASGRNGTLYIGVTNDIARRAYEHKHGLVKGFASSHSCTHLVYFEGHETMPLAIGREKNLKRYLRAWKLELIERSNPEWRDLYEDLNK